ncbi:Adenylate kinase 1 [Diplonema papillatum]|nr:Adenylate kinase 1 [Diplonema papillatum]
MHATLVRLFPLATLKAKPAKLLFLGAPGVGKGTYATRLAADTGYEHVSTGNILRQEVADGTDIGRAAKDSMDRGELVPSSIVDEMVKAKLLSYLASEKGFILDGYPRNLDQAKTVAAYIDVDLVVNLVQPFNVIIDKISGRRSCARCGHGYNLSTVNLGGITMEPLLPKVDGICDNCSGPLEMVQRDDDKLEIVRRRLELYTEVTKPIEEFYKDRLHIFEVLGSTKKYYPLFLEFLKDRVTTI